MSHAAITRCFAAGHFTVLLDWANSAL
jgi:hypothetical protein